MLTPKRRGIHFACTHKQRTTEAKRFPAWGRAGARTRNKTKSNTGQLKAMGPAPWDPSGHGAHRTAIGQSPTGLGTVSTCEDPIGPANAIGPVVQKARSASRRTATFSAHQAYGCIGPCSPSGRSARSPLGIEFHQAHTDSGAIWASIFCISTSHLEIDVIGLPLSFRSSQVGHSSNTSGNKNHRAIGSIWERPIPSLSRPPTSDACHHCESRFAQ